MNMFEDASRLKLRFETERGNVTVEDLWDLPLTSRNNVCLDSVAKSVSRKIKNSEEESFVEKKTATNALLDLAFEIVKRIIEVRLIERDAKKLAVTTKARKEKLLSVIASKEDTALENLEIDDLKKMLEDM